MQNNSSFDTKEKHLEDRIPKLIHQVYPSVDLPEVLIKNVEHIRTINDDWSYTLYDDKIMEDFILAEYGYSVLDAYTSLSPLYGAARADLFRYLLLYKKGGVYLDIKSTLSRPLQDVIRGDEGFVLSKWKNGPGEEFSGAGLHEELSALPGGEYQQWHIICAPRHPFLAAVIDRVLENIACYRPWRAGVGRTGVLRVTGPIAYTLAIEPIKPLHKHIELDSQFDLGFQYSTLGTLDHRTLFKQHYTHLDVPLVSASGWSRAIVPAYIAARRLKHRLLRRNERL